MIRGLYTAVSGLITQEAKQDVITNNMANASTIGFKADDTEVRSFKDVLLANHDKEVGGKNVKNVIGSLSLGSELDQVSTNFNPGTLQDTGNWTDFAINGNGFFAVMRNDGVSSKEMYTRDGQFHVNSGGYLVTDSGDSVLGKNLTTGKTEPIYVGASKATSDSEGNLTIDGSAKYKLRTVDFNDYTSLKKVGDNLYDGTNPIDTTNVSVKQNSLETSNVNVINEMTNMMSVMRTFETNQKVIQAMDETLGKAVNEVGTVR